MSKYIFYITATAAVYVPDNDQRELLDYPFLFD